MYEEELKLLGLTDNETKIYLILLRNKPLNPTNIAKISGMHRSYVYDTLERLMEKGLVSIISVNNKKHYKALDPNILKETIELKLKTINSVIPALSTLYSENKDEVDVELHRGKRVYGIVIKDIVSRIEENSEVLVMGVNESLVDEIEPIYIRQYLKILEEKNMREKIIISEGSEKIDHKNLEYKERSKDIIGNNFVILYNNKSYVFIPTEPFFLIIIESKEFYESQKKMFKFLWES